MRIKGLDAAFRKIQNLKKDTDAEIRRVLAETGASVASQARANAPSHMGELKRSIDFTVAETGYTVTIFAAAKHAPYVEFGTGLLTKVPKGFEDYAYDNFFVNGKGTTHPQPFLFPPAIAAYNSIGEKMAAALNKIAKNT